MITDVVVALLAVLGPPRLADDPYAWQLSQFDHWLRSPYTAVLLAVAFAALVALLVVPPNRRSGSHMREAGTLLVVALGAFATLAWVSHNQWLILVSLAVLWGCVGWAATGAGVIGAIAMLPGRLRRELDPVRRAEFRHDRSQAAGRGAALTRVLDEIEGERR